MRKSKLPGDARDATGTVIAKDIYLSEQRCGRAQRLEPAATVGRVADRTSPQCLPGRLVWPWFAVDWTQSPRGHCQRGSFEEALSGGARSRGRSTNRLEPDCTTGRIDRLSCWCA